MQVFTLVILTAVNCIGIAIGSFQDNVYSCKSDNCQNSGSQEHTQRNRKLTKRAFMTNSIHCTASTSFIFNSSQACEFCDSYCPCRGPSRDIDFSPCASENDCGSDESCVFGACVDPCIYFSCPHKTVCQPSSHRVACRAIRPGVTSCRWDRDCPTEEACYGGKCVDLCSNPICEGGLICKTQDHRAYCVRGTVENSPAEGGNRKKYVVETRFPTNWYNAYLHCRRDKGQLASIESAEDQAEMELTLRNVGDAFATFWIGGTDLAKQGEFSWMHNGQAFGTYKNWRSGQPDNYQDNEHCVEIWDASGTGNHVWNDQNCTNIRFFVCQY